MIDKQKREPGAARRIAQKRFQQPASAHSGVGEKETLNINAVSPPRLGGVCLPTFLSWTMFVNFANEWLNMQ